MDTTKQLMERIDNVIHWLNNSDEGKRMVSNACGIFVDNVEMCADREGGHFS